MSIGGFGVLLLCVQLRPSPLHGHGLFTLAAVPRGTPIWRFEPGFDQVFTPEAWAQLPEPARAHVRHFCFVRQHDHALVLSGDLARFLNHSSVPTTGMPEGGEATGVTVALRDLEPGEELTCNYWSYDADTAWKLGWAAPNAELAARGPLGSERQEISRPTS